MIPKPRPGRRLREFRRVSPRHGAMGIAPAKYLRDRQLRSCLRVVARLTDLSGHWPPECSTGDVLADGRDAMSDVLAEVMFPEAEHRVALLSEQTIVSAVAVAIAFDFFLPEPPILLGHVPALRTAVPETTVNENNEVFQ